MANIDDTLTALADPTRRQVVDLLRERPWRAGELAARFPISGPAMSRHLRVLRDSGLVEARFVDGDARAREYRLLPERLGDLHAWLERVQAFWNEQLEAFRLHVEEKR